MHLVNVSTATESALQYGILLTLSTPDILGALIITIYARRLVWAFAVARDRRDSLPSVFHSV